MLIFGVSAIVYIFYYYEIFNRFLLILAPLPKLSNAINMWFYCSKLIDIGNIFHIREYTQKTFS